MNCLNMVSYSNIVVKMKESVFVCVCMYVYAYNDADSQIPAEDFSWEENEKTEWNENESSLYQNLWDLAKALLKRKFIALKCFH